MTSTIFLILSILAKMTAADLVSGCAEITGYSHFWWNFFAIADNDGGHNHCQIYKADFPVAPTPAPVTGPTKAPTPQPASYPDSGSTSWDLKVNNDLSFLAPDPTDVNYWPVTVRAAEGTASCADPAPISEETYTLNSPDAYTFYSGKKPKTPSNPYTNFPGSGHALVRYGRKESPTDCAWKDDEVREENIALDVCFFWVGAYIPRYASTSCTGSGPYTLTTSFYTDTGCSNPAINPVDPVGSWYPYTYTDGGPHFGCNGPYLSGSSNPAAPGGNIYQPWYTDAKFDQIDILNCWTQVGACLIAEDDPGANAIAKHHSKFSLAVVILLGAWHTVQFLL